MAQWQYHPLLLLFHFGVLVSLAIAVYAGWYARRHEASYTVLAVGVLAFFNAVWTLFAALKVASVPLESKLLWYKLEFLGSWVNPSVAVVLALAYTRRERWITPRTVGALLAVPAVTIPLLFLNPGDAMIVDPVRVPVGEVQAFEHDFPPLFSMVFVWNVVLMLSAASLVVHGAVTDRVPKAPASLVAATLVIPVAVVLVKMFEVYPPGGDGINVAPAASSIGISLLAVAVFSYRLFELVPVGRDRAVEAFEDGYLMVDPGGKILDANPAARRLLAGSPDATVVGEAATDLVPVYEDLARTDGGVLEPDRSTGVTTAASGDGPEADDRDGPFNGGGSATSGPDPETGDDAEPTFERDGRILQVQSGPASTRDRAVGTVLLIRDVTRRIRRQRELERFEHLVETLPVGIYRTGTGPDGEDYVNEALVDVFGADSKEQLRALDPADLYVDDEDRAAFLDDLRETGVVTDRELRMQTVDGQERWVSASERRVETGDGVYSEGAVLDVTERKEYQRELERARRAARSERDGKEAIRRLVLETTSGTEIADSVCRLLVESYGYDAAWVTGDAVTATDGDGAEPTASHGDDRGFRSATGDGDVDPVTRRGVETGDATSTSVTDDGAVADALEERGFRAIRSVPLASDGVAHGTLSVLRADEEPELEETLVEEFADAIAFKRQVTRQQEALTAETVVEVGIRIDDSDHFLVALTSAGSFPDDAEVIAHEARTESSNGTTYVLTAEDVTTPSLVSGLDGLPDVRDVTVVGHESSSKAVVRVRTDTPTLGAVMSDLGGVVRSIRTRDGTLDVVAEFPRRTDVAAVVETVDAHWEGAVLRSRNERPVESSRPSAFEGLTERQEQALRVASASGFFDRPQQATAAEVAETLGISRTTFLKHLRSAEQTIFERTFGGMDDQ